MRCDFAALKPIDRALPDLQRPQASPAGGSCGGDRCGSRISVVRPCWASARLDPRDEIAAIGLVVGMLQLAAAAFGKVAARRLLVVRPGRQRAIVEQHVAGHAEGDVAAAWRHAVAARRDADDRLAHSAASAAGLRRRDRRRSSPARRSRPRGRAARRRRRPPRTPRMPARAQRRDHARQARRRSPRLPARPAPAARSRAARRATRPACPGPCRRPPRPIAAPLPAPARP